MKPNPPKGGSALLSHYPWRVELEITPPASDEERAAIAAALAEETEDEPSAWARTVLPDRDELEGA